MTDSLIDMARARRLRALSSLEGPRRERPWKARIFSGTRFARGQAILAA